MRRLRLVGSLLFVLALLVGVLLFRNLGLERLSSVLVTAMQDERERHLPPEEEARGLAEARRLPKAQRIDALLNLVGRGSRKASGEIELWVERDSFRKAALRPEQREALSYVAWRTPHRATRRAAAALLLAELHRASPPSSLEGWSALPEELQREALAALGLWALRDEAPADALRWLDHDAQRTPQLRAARLRALAGFGLEGETRLLASLKGLSSAETEEVDALTRALLDQAAIHGAAPQVPVETCLTILEAEDSSTAARGVARAYLEGVSGRALGDDPEAWRDWWQRSRELLQRYER